MLQILFDNFNLVSLYFFTLMNGNAFKILSLCIPVTRQLLLICQNLLQHDVENMNKNYTS